MRKRTDTNTLKECHKMQRRPVRSSRSREEPAVWLQPSQPAEWQR